MNSQKINLFKVQISHATNRNCAWKMRWINIIYLVWPPIGPQCSRQPQPNELQMLNHRTTLRSSIWTGKKKLRIIYGDLVSCFVLRFICDAWFWCLDILFSVNIPYLNGSVAFCFLFCTLYTRLVSGSSPSELQCVFLFSAFGLCDRILYLLIIGCAHKYCYCCWRGAIVRQRQLLITSHISWWKWF